jgi:hypothetical protein
LRSLLPQFGLQTRHISFQAAIVILSEAKNPSNQAFEVAFPGNEKLADLFPAVPSSK